MVRQMLTEWDGDGLGGLPGKKRALVTSISHQQLSSYLVPTILLITWR